jgi:hypothetical protein
LPLCYHRYCCISCLDMRVSYCFCFR